jgi:hypothetical protein
MSRNPLLACDVLLRQCDQSFSNGATGSRRNRLPSSGTIRRRGRRVSTACSSHRWLLARICRSKAT